MELPHALRLAIAGAADSTPREALARAAGRLSEGYREGAATPVALPSAEGATAYAVTRLPATFAAIAAALAETRDRAPEWRPQTLLDAGAGPGICAWAASAVWPGLGQATLVERDGRMIALGQRLSREAPPGPTLTWRQADIATGARWLPERGADLCVCSYALNELPHAARLPLVERLWRATTGALVLIAPGTPAGFAAIREARAWLAEAGAHLLAPCPHADACPMPAGDWCHFSQRLARSQLHRQLKGGAAPYEDEKFSYIVAARWPGVPIAARVTRHPLTRPGVITLELCAPGGLERQTITRSQRNLWRMARDAKWGSALPVKPSDGALDGAAAPANPTVD